jgi:hypothetical protein
MSSTRYSYQVLRKLEFSQQIFKKFSNIKFYEDPSSESQIVPCEQVGGQTDVMKLTVTFRSFANAPKNWYILLASGLSLTLLLTLSMKE